MNTNQLGLFRKYLRISAQLNPQIMSDCWAAIDPIEGWLLPNQFILLYTIGLSFEGKLVEVGSYKGRSACVWCMTTDPNYTQIHCVDRFIWDGNEYLIDFKRNLDKFNFFNKVNVHKVNIHVGLSVDMAKDHLDESADMIYIDAGHEYNDVVTDINAWAPKLKKGGLLIGHDYPDPNDPNGGFEGLSKAVNELIRDNPKNYKDFGFYCGVWGAIKL